jgi:hydroxyacylglutathione hydrolase
MKAFDSYPVGDLVIYQTPTLWNTYQNYNYIVGKDKQAIVIDPGESTPIVKTLETNHLQAAAIYLTHHHHDHAGAAEELQKKFECSLLGFEGDQHRLPPLTGSYAAGDTLDFFGHPGQVMHLPGHTSGLCAFYLEDLGVLFSNDLLFSIGCGRVFEGTFQQMFASLQQVRELPDTTQVFCSHEYTESNLRFARHLFPNDSALAQAEPQILEKRRQKVPTVPTLLGFEKQCNPFLRWDDPSLRKTLNLMDAEDWQVFAEIRRLKDRA